MDGKLRRALARLDTDIQGAVKRFNGDEALYLTCLGVFLDDPTITQLNTAIARQAWDEAFTAAHALKGLAGNMGFVPLMHSAGQLVIMIRSGRTGELEEYTARLNSDHRDISGAIKDTLIREK